MPKLLPKWNRMSQLVPLLSSEGLLRVGGRIRNAPISDRMRHPIILPKNNRVVELIVQHVHETSGHSGREYVLSLLHERYWLVGARHTIRRVLRRCVSHRRMFSQPAQQQMGDLPKGRVTPGKPPGLVCGGRLFWSVHGKARTQ